MLIRFHSVFPLSESQPKKIRKVPPGLPSSVSVSIQKRCCLELYLSPHSQSMGAHVFVFYDPFSHSIWHLKPLLGSQSSRIAAIQDFQLLQLCICTTELRKKKKKEGGGEATHSPSRSFAAYIYSVLYLWALYFTATFLPLCQVYSLDHWREFILGFDGSYSTSFFSLPFSLSGHPISSSSLFLPSPSSFLPHTHTPPPSPSRRLPPLSLSLPPPSLYPSCQWSWLPSRIRQMVQ